MTETAIRPPATQRLGTTTLVAESPRAESQRYSNPYAAGAALGLVLLGSFFVAGRGLGASGGFTWVAAHVAPIDRTDDGAWLAIELLGVIAGGFTSAVVARRIGGESKPRFALPLAGGVAMGVGAALAHGCTSGLALTGGALLSVGAWAFMIAMFATALILAPLFRWAWR